MPKRSIWLWYDLGLQGDYASPYQWLDAHGAKECGDSTALVNVEYSESLKDDLKDELARSIDINKKTRQARGALDGVLVSRSRGCRRGGVLIHAHPR
jgi:hypothetical protein